MGISKFIWSLFGSEFAIQLLLTSLFFMPWKRRRSYFALRFSLFIIIYFVVGRFVPTPAPWVYLALFVLLLAGVWVCFEGSFTHALFYSVNAYCAQHIMSTIAYAVVFTVVVKTRDFSLFWLTHNIASYSSMVLIFIASFFLYTKRQFKKDAPNFSNPIIIYASALFICVAVFLTHYGQIASVRWGADAWEYLERMGWSGVEALEYLNAAGIRGLETQIFMKLASTLYAVSTMVINEMNCRNKKLQTENSILQLLLSKDMEKYEQAKLSNERIKIKYHDLKQKEHQGVMAREDMQELDGDKEAMMNAYFTGNKALDIIISEKAMLCEKKNIKLICTADADAINFIKSHHIYSLLGNAFDNAIEGLSNVTETEKRVINASIVRRGNMCLVRVTNYLTGNVIIENGLPLTTKADKENHGYGVKSMRNIAEFYGGDIHFSVADNNFALLIMVPVPAAAH